jgi:probable rRNA maturation factor
MNERMTNKNALNKKNVSSAGSGRKRGMTIDISGKAPGVSRSELRTWARAILRHLHQTQAELSLALVTDPTIHALNHQYRGKDKPTDVLSFPLADEIQPFLLGDLVISVDTAVRQAQRRGYPLQEELQILLIHGILHLLGYDHEVSRSEAIRMHRKEREVMKVVRGAS